MTEESNRVLLRAELTAGGVRSVGHTLAVTADFALIEVERRLEVGSAVSVRLSFPRLFQAVERTARVAAVFEGGAPGAPSGVELQFLHRSPEERERFAESLARPDRSTSRERLLYRVLLVEDNVFIRDMFAYGVNKYFRGRHAEVTVEMAVNGGEAWTKLCNASYDLAIIDYYLPVLDGAALLARARREPRLARLPLVGMSIGGGEARRAMLDAGADLFLNKPLKFSDLCQTLERLATAHVGI